MKKNYTTFFLFFLFILISISTCQLGCKKDKSSIELTFESEQKKNKDYTCNYLPESTDSLIKEAIKIRDMANFKDALLLSFKALDIASQNKDTTREITALHEIGTNLRRLSSNTEAYKYYHLAEDLAANKEKYHHERAVSLNGIGNSLLSLKKNIKAREYFREALKMAIEEENFLGQVINNSNLGETFIEENLDSAIYYYEKSLDLSKYISSGPFDSRRSFAICNQSLANLYLKKGESKKALELAKEASRILQNSTDLVYKFRVEKNLCEILIELGQINEAEALIPELLTLAQNIDSFEFQHKVYILISTINQKKKNYKAALEANQQAIAYRDSMSYERIELRLFELENERQRRIISEKIKVLTQKKELAEKAKVTQKITFITLTFALLFLLGFLYSRFTVKQKMSRELSKINEMKSCFFGNVSHELRTPLTLIKSPLEKWLTKSLPPELKTDAEIMHRNSIRLLFLVEQLLTLTKVDAGCFKIEYKTADLSLVLKGISQEYKHQQKEKQINYKVQIQESGTVIFDPNIIEIILTNLLNNAFKFTPVKGEVTVIGEITRNQYKITVRNSVNHLNNDKLDDLFKRFYTNSDSQGSSSGIGIGLALVKELCLLYKAKSSVVKNKTNEIDFIIELPITIDETTIKQSEEKKNTIELENEQSNTCNLNNNNGKEELENDTLLNRAKPILLVVEDNYDMLEYIANSFENIFIVIKAKDGLEGIKYARKFIPDLIISDIMMPTINGIQLCSAIKNDSLTDHIPIILLTALAAEDTMLQALESRADDYTTKPFSIKTLTAKALNLIHIRKSLSEKYREEIVIKPLNTLIKGGKNSFNDTLKEILENDIVNPDFGVDSFCEKTSMSRSQLYRKLKATVGMSITEFTRIHRLKIASEFLKHTELNIADVCYASGFNDTSYFSKSFKEVFGVTPIEYKKNLKECIAGEKNTTETVHFQDNPPDFQQEND